MSSDTYTVADVVTHFERETSLHLHTTAEMGGYTGIVMLGARSLSRTSEGDLVAADDAALTRRFGHFYIVVHQSAEAAQAFSSGSPDESESSIVWREHLPEQEGEVPGWSARKLFANVELIWFSEKRVTDERWAELDSILTSLDKWGSSE